jgi:Holliday junction DNA helicase RuvA
MFGYITGIIKYITSDYVIIDNQKIGYIVHVANPYVYEEGEEATIYTYNFISESENSLYGFKTMDEKNLFLKLINVKGLGPKTALPMLASGTINGIADAIERENILYLKKFPKVGDKLAKQMILDLKGKLGSIGVIETQEDELVEVLENLGYKTADINKVIPKVDRELSIENQIKEALKLMLK